MIPARLRGIGNPCSGTLCTLQNIHVPTPHLSISAIRIFGSEGKPPFDPHRHEDRRDITHLETGEEGLRIQHPLGIAPDVLQFLMVYGDECRYLMKCLSTDQNIILLSNLSMKVGISNFCR